MNERYSRQIVFGPIGETGQKKLLEARVAVLGLGALGTVIANNLARSGVGYLRLVDRDYVEISNLQRQILFNEADCQNHIPKAVAAEAHLKRINSEIIYDPVIKDINPASIEALLDGIDLVLDGTDNFETRMLINDVCCKHVIPWIYGGALSSHGMTMNIIPGKTACLHCLYNHAPAPGSLETCTSAGVLNMITGLIGCIESVEAVKYLVGSPDLSDKMRYFDIWESRFESIDAARNKNCPACGKHVYEFLDNTQSTYTTSLCGRDSIQVVPAKQGRMDFPVLAEKLNKLGTVSINPYMLTFITGKLEITLFVDGRAIIKNAADENAAKSIYAEYIGL